MTDPEDYAGVDGTPAYELTDRIYELTLMLDIFNSSIVTGVLPLKDSPCHKKILELMERNGRKPTAGSE